MDLNTSLLSILLIVGISASVGGVLAVRRSSDTVVRALGAVGIVLGVLFAIYALVVLLLAAV